MQSQIEQLLKRLPQPIRDDPKKGLVLAALLVLLGGMTLRQFWPVGKPATADASADELLGSSPDEVLPNVGPIRMVKSEKLEEWLGKPIRPLKRNVFELKTEFYRVAGGKVTESAVEAGDELFWDRLAKSITSRADQRRQKQIRLENLQLAASKLKLQSTVMGSQARALIDGKLLRLNDVVEAGGMTFKLVRIEARRILVERDAVRVEVPMGSNRVRIITPE